MCVTVSRELVNAVKALDGGQAFNWSTREALEDVAYQMQLSGMSSSRIQYKLKRALENYVQHHMKHFAPKVEAPAPVAPKEDPAKKVVEKISKAKAIKLLKEHRESGSGRIFSVIFEKRNSGNIRQMTARFDVKKHLKGGKLSYNPDDQALMSVFDVQAEGYRTINLLGLIQLKLNGVEYVVA